MTRAERVLLRGGTPGERLHAIREVATPERIECLKGLPYEVFLRTGYWRIITAHLRAERGACERCGYNRQLQAHHKSYAHHGLEHEHLEDLELLCRWCHATEHGIEAKRDGWTPIGLLLPSVTRAIGLEGRCQ